MREPRGDEVGKDKGLQTYIKVGVQERPGKYGRGDTKRVVEIPVGDASIGINMGDIANVPTDAVMCPSTPWLEVGGGAIENRLADAMGSKAFENATRELQGHIADVVKVSGVQRAFAARELADYFQGATGLQVSVPPEQFADQVLVAAHMTDLKEVGEHVELEYGAAIPIISGRLAKSGIETVVLVNVTPVGKSMTKADMSRFTLNACRIAGLTGAESITIPAVGTGFAAAFGFGMSQEDSLRGFYDGARQYLNESPRSPLKKIDYNIYAKATEENAKQAAQLLHKVGAK